MPTPAIYGQAIYGQTTYAVTDVGEEEPPEEPPDPGPGLHNQEFCPPAYVEIGLYPMTVTVGGDPLAWRLDRHMVRDRRGRDLYRTAPGTFVYHGAGIVTPPASYTHAFYGGRWTPVEDAIADELYLAGFAGGLRERTT